MPQVVADIGEVGVIARIREAVSRAWPDSPHVRMGIGDDAAIVDLDRSCVVTTDSVIEGVHFRQHWVSAHDVGRKIAARNFADIVAMGARPRALVVALAMPADTTVQWCDEFLAGVIDETMRAGAVIVGGDTSSAPALMVSATALGDAGNPTVTRAGARAGDVVAVSGTVGVAAAGLALLSVGSTQPSGAIAAYASPRPDYALALQAAQFATSMIDCSDGVVTDLGHIARASGCDIRIRSACLPQSEAVTDAAAALGCPAQQWLLTGGEDHVFLASFPASDVVPDGFTVIGEVVAGEGSVWVDDHRWQGSAGYEHFTDAATAPRS